MRGTSTIQWQIALTSRLLLSPRHASRLSSSRPVLERRMRRILAYLISPGTFLAVAAWRRMAKEGRRNIKLDATEAQVVASAATLELCQRHHSNKRMSAALAAWRATAGRMAVAQILVTRADDGRLRQAFRRLVANCWRRWYVGAVAERIVARRLLVVAAPVLRAFAHAASCVRTSQLCAALAATHARQCTLGHGWSALVAFAQSALLEADRLYAASSHCATRQRGELLRSFDHWSQETRLYALPLRWSADLAQRGALGPGPFAVGIPVGNEHRFEV